MEYTLPPPERLGKPPPSRRFSDVILPISALPAGVKTLGVIRASTRDQDRRGTLLRQRYGILNVLIGRNPVVGVYERVGSGTDAYWWTEVVREAKTLGANDILIDNGSRALRHPDYHSVERPDLLPLPGQLEDFRRRVRNVNVYSVCEPEADARQIRAHESRRGKSITGNWGGRRRLRSDLGKKIWISILIRMREAGYSYRTISTLTQIPKSVVYELLTKIAREAG